VTTVDQPGEPASDAFAVVINDLGQHALWRTESDVPPGWRHLSPAMSRSECLAVIERSWRDVTPASARSTHGDCATYGAGGPFVHELFAEQASRRRR
jgi:MbtH protein